MQCAACNPGAWTLRAASRASREKRTLGEFGSSSAPCAMRRRRLQRRLPRATRSRTASFQKRGVDAATIIMAKLQQPAAKIGAASIDTQPDAGGHFGRFGGRFAPETLMRPLEELEEAYLQARSDPQFQKELDGLLRDYAGRPTPITLAARLGEHLGGARIYLKREDLLHTGAHKINNCLGQGLLAARMGKTRVIAETGAGQHGVATATVAALLGLQCTVYMGEEDMARQSPNVFRMRLLGSEVVPANSGSRTLKDAIN